MYKLVAKFNLGSFTLESVFYKTKSREKIVEQFNKWKKNRPEYSWVVRKARK